MAYKALGNFFNRLFRNTLNDNFDAIQKDIAALNKRIDNLVAPSGNSVAELQDLRTSSISGRNYASAKARVDAVENLLEATRLVSESGGKYSILETSLSGLFDPGFYYAGSSTTGKPSGADVGTVEVIRVASTAYIQRYTEARTTKVYTRYHDGSAWTAWKRVAQTDEVQMTKLTRDDGTANYDAGKSNLDAFVTAGFHNIGSEITANRPVSSNGVVLVIQRNTSSILQVYFADSAAATGIIYFRRSSDSGATWSTWVKVI